MERLSGHSVILSRLLVLTLAILAGIVASAYGQGLVPRRYEMLSLMGAWLHGRSCTDTAAATRLNSGILSFLPLTTAPLWVTSGLRRSIISMETTQSGSRISCGL